MEQSFEYKVNPNILILAKETLSQEEINESERITEQLLSNKLKDFAIRKLMSLIGVKPKRPLYYLNHELNFLPEYTRTTIFYAGSYIALLVQYLAQENSIKYYLTLGSHLSKARALLGEKLYNDLFNYNKFIYVPAKHEFNFTDKPHLFSAKETVITLMITLNLAKKIVELSPKAKAYTENKLF
jgi:hypothetical protein